MKESYGEGVATHADPESCVGNRKVAGEALTGAHAGRVSSRETPATLWGADVFGTGGRQHGMRRNGKTHLSPTRSKTPCTHGNTSHGSREIPRPLRAVGSRGRIGKSKDAIR
jgi:hypothetical protein